MNGWIETQEQIDERWSRMKFEADKVRILLMQITEADADRLHDLLTNPMYDADGKIVTVTKSAWKEEMAQHGYAFNSRRLQAENEARKELHKEYNKLFK